MINFIDVSRHNKEILSKIIKKLPNFVNSGKYILGENLKAFEESFASYCDSSYAVGVNCGTDALTLSLLSLNKPKSGEVLTVSMTFPATALAILDAGYTPRYVDVDLTGTMCPKDLEKKVNSKTVAIIPVHFMGHVCNMTKIKAIADSHKIPIIEDACQSAGGTHNSKKAGSFGYTGCFSFFPTKNLSCLGDGGMIVTNNKGTYDKLCRLRDFGRIGRENFDTFGINSRLDEFQAIILNEKLKYLDKWIASRRAKAKYYDKKLSEKALIRAPKNSLSTYHLYVIKVTDNLKVIEELKKEGIDCRAHYSIPCHRQKFFKSKDSLPVTDFLSTCVISLPISEFISKRNQDKIIKLVMKYII